MRRMPRKTIVLLSPLSAVTLGNWALGICFFYPTSLLITCLLRLLPKRLSWRTVYGQMKLNSIDSYKRTV